MWRLWNDPDVAAVVVGSLGYAVVMDIIDTYQFNRYFRKETQLVIQSELSLWFQREVEKFEVQRPGEDSRGFILVNGLVSVDEEGWEEDYFDKEISADAYEALECDVMLYGLKITDAERAAGTREEIRRYRQGRDWETAPTQAVAIDRRYRIDESNVHRVSLAAKALASVFNCPASAYVAGCYIDQPAISLADSIGVRVISIPDKPNFQLDYVTRMFSTPRAAPP